MQARCGTHSVMQTILDESQTSPKDHQNHGPRKSHLTCDGTFSLLSTQSACHSVQTSGLSNRAPAFLGLQTKSVQRGSQGKRAPQEPSAVLRQTMFGEAARARELHKCLPQTSDKQCSESLVAPLLATADGN